MQILFFEEMLILNSLGIYFSFLTETLQPSHTSLLINIILTDVQRITSVQTQKEQTTNERHSCSNPAVYFGVRGFDSYGSKIFVMSITAFKCLGIIKYIVFTQYVKYYVYLPVICTHNTSYRLL